MAKTACERTKHHPTVTNIIRAVTVASSTDAILVFLFPVLLLNYFGLDMALVTLIYSVVRILGPVFPYATGWVIDRCDLRRMLIIAYQLALCIPLILIAAYYLTSPTARFALALASAVINTVVFSLVIGQEALIAELSPQPQRSILIMFSYGSTALFLGSLGLTAYFAAWGAIVPLLAFKAVTDAVALCFTVRAMRHAPPRWPQLQAASAAVTADGAETPLWRLALSLVTMSAMLGLATYYLTYLVPIAINALFQQTYVVSASFVVFNGASGAVNFLLARRLPDRMSSAALGLVFGLTAACLFLFAALGTNMAVYAVWLLLFAVLYSLLNSFGRLHMTLKVPARLKGRMRGGMQGLGGVMAGAFAWAFLQWFGNSPALVAQASVVVMVVSAAGYLAAGIGTLPNPAEEQR